MYMHTCVHAERQAPAELFRPLLPPYGHRQASRGCRRAGCRYKLKHKSVGCILLYSILAFILRIDPLHNSWANPNTIYLSIYLSTNVPIYLSIYLSLSIYFYLSIYLCIYIQHTCVHAVCIAPAQLLG